MMQEMISIVVLTYNQEATIGRTLDAILMQRCHLPFEIVIGEDSSTDHTRAICQEYAQKHPDTIRLFCNTQNKGIVNNYFDCLLQCRGKYIADCAGDDFWTDTEKLEKELGDWKEQDEDVLSYALFPQVAMDFFKHRKALREGNAPVSGAVECSVEPV